MSLYDELLSSVNLLTPYIIETQLSQRPQTLVLADVLGI